MSGHVFHPGHEELHGVTVVVTGSGGRRDLGRYHETNARGVVLHDVAIFDPGFGTLSPEEWLARQWKYGVLVTERHLVLPIDEVGSIARFMETSL